jgi:hypothetical protein
MCMQSCGSQGCSSTSIARCQTACVGGTNGLSQPCAQCVIAKSGYTQTVGSSECTYLLANTSDCPADCRH